MKLAEIISLIEELETRASNLKKQLLRTSPQVIFEAVEELNNVLSDRQYLILLRDRLETETVTEGSSLRELRVVLSSLEEKLDILHKIGDRDGLPEEVAVLLFKQMDLLTKTKSQLAVMIQKLCWDVEVEINA